MSVLEGAIRMAVEAHTAGKDKAGRPYILHPLAVMFAAERAYRPSVIVTLEEFMAAAVLHDVPEDHPEYSLSSILAEFGENVHRIVDGMRRLLSFSTQLNLFPGAKYETSRILLSKI